MSLINSNNINNIIRNNDNVRRALNKKLSQMSEGEGGLTPEEKAVLQVAQGTVPENPKEEDILDAKESVSAIVEYDTWINRGQNSLGIKAKAIPTRGYTPANYSAIEVYVGGSLFSDTPPSDSGQLAFRIVLVHTEQITIHTHQQGETPESYSLNAEYGDYENLNPNIKVLEETLTYYSYKYPWVKIVKVNGDAPDGSVLDFIDFGTYSPAVIQEYHSGNWINRDYARPVDAQPQRHSTNLVESEGIYNSIHPHIENSYGTVPVGGFNPNVPYDLSTLTGEVPFSFQSFTMDTGIVNTFLIRFVAGSTPPTIMWPTTGSGSAIYWEGGVGPTINANKHYIIEIKVLASYWYGTYKEFDRP